ncbi:antimicrobial peptide resistance and lipid A acylation protein PagP [Vibrio phage Ceto]|uniref:Uncharacterized protein n=1 Tax=Vibrio phage Ceto TaxID=2570300 RepID=A0A2H5BGN6_9CAUD|nr:antimicrobial peptide resistance and lipid A acylation protein PagP [Vibrio phage Ceto]AUG85156.1 hypothetical protein CETO_174 [Vibrio phage Ceto]
MIKYVITLVCLVLTLGFSFDAAADDSIYLGGFSYHFEDDRNNINPLLFYQKDGYVGGYFYNSFENHSLLLGKDFSIHRDGITIGVVPSIIYGYEKKQTLAACTGKICLGALPYIKFDYDEHWSPAVIVGGTFFTAIVEYKF